MNVLQKLFSPVRHLLAVFFSHDVSLRRDEGSLRIVLAQPDGPPGTPRPLTREQIKLKKEAQELALMREQLAELLDASASSRGALRHLVFVEQALAKKGLRALHKLPLEVLQRALDQFEGVVTNWSPAGLASLRSKMAVAIIDREHMDPDAEADAYNTAAVMDALPSEPTPAEVQADSGHDDEALAAAYAALGVGQAGPVETQVELGSPSARAVTRAVVREQTQAAPLSPEATMEFRLRELQH
jgi:hypothetical protein